MNGFSGTPACEIITIGSEILLGQIIDTNTSYIAQELNRIGIMIRFQTAVGDCLEEIIGVIEKAVDRCDMVLTTGGLGPTMDDLTREAVAQMAGVDLDFRQELMEQIEELFHRAGYQMPENNQRQAYVPKGSHAISNPVGSAPGFILESKGKPIICLPGVPRELEFLLGQEIIPWLRKRFHLAAHTLTYRVLKTAGIGESKVDSLIGDLMGSDKNPEVGLLASAGEIKIRIAAKAEDPSGAEALIRAVEEEILSRLGDKVYGVDDATLEGVVNSILLKRGLTLAVFETFTGGLVAHRLHGLPSPQLLECLVIPGKEHLNKWLGARNDPVEAETSATMAAEKIRESSDSDTGLAILGFIEKQEKGYNLKGSVAT
ncbi:MAG: CinA family nicotinamide mononucleotide deamidase-related protein, partial [Pseudomonadota bacterium]